MKIKKRNLIFLGSLLVTIYIYMGSHPNHKAPKSPMSVSVSSNGKFVVTSHHGKLLTLWDLKEKTSTLISNDANIYSAYFIRNTDMYMWQDIETDTVHINNVQGTEIKSFKPGFASYGQLMSKDLYHYLASDEKWNVYKIVNKEKK